jgi:hypothetical protein
MIRPGGCLTVWTCALALFAAAFAPSARILAQERESDDHIFFLEPTASLDDVLQAQAELAVDIDSADSIEPPAAEQLPGDALNGAGPVDAVPEGVIPLDDSDVYYEYSASDFTWQVGPSGIIYRSYLAGPHEPRISITPFFHSNRALWDATVGGRGGILRYGDRDPLHPHGWQLDVYGASIVRMDAENHQDLDSADFVFGFPLTYGIADWQFKLGYAHLSSHLGDEFAIRNPGALADRRNYVRDGIVWGSSWFPTAACRLYGEFDWAFHVSDGAGPIHFQFGNELSRPGPTGLHGSPFLALNGRMREEVNYGGDLTAQTGWLWRGETGKVFRIGAHYYNGKSSQSQFFNVTEEQIGMGLWYDF